VRRPALARCPGCRRLVNTAPKLITISHRAERIEVGNWCSSDCLLRHLQRGFAL